MTTASDRPRQIHWFETLALMNVALAAFESVAKGDGWLPIAVVTVTFSGLTLAITRGRSRIAFWAYTCVVGAMFAVVAFGLCYLALTRGLPSFTLTGWILSLFNLGLNVSAMIFLWSNQSRNWLRKTD